MSLEDDDAQSVTTGWATGAFDLCYRCGLKGADYASAVDGTMRGFHKRCMPCFAGAVEHPYGKKPEGAEETEKVFSGWKQTTFPGGVVRTETPYATMIHVPSVWDQQQETMRQQAERITQLETALKLALRYTQPGDYHYACVWAERDALKDRNGQLERERDEALEREETMAIAWASFAGDQSQTAWGHGCSVAAKVLGAQVDRMRFARWLDSDPATERDEWERRAFQTAEEAREAEERATKAEYELGVWESYGARLKRERDQARRFAAEAGNPVPLLVPVSVEESP